MKAILGTWPLFLGMLLLMVGNGLQGTLLGVRGSIEGFTTAEMSVVMSAYFVGFLGGARLAPRLIQRVGHVRVFAALGSFISAGLILYPTVTEPWAWIVLRVVIGFCFCGVYVTAESWLNDRATNQTRGMLLSIYMVVQTAGIVIAQYILVLGDPSGFVLFVVPSVLVSISFAPILLSAAPSPAFSRTKAMGFRQLFRSSPTGCVGMFLSGGVFAAMFGMSAVYGSLQGLTLPQISAFVASFYVGGLVLVFPIGWISDRMDRRKLILIVSGAGGAGGAGAGGVAGLVPGAAGRRGAGRRAGQPALRAADRLHQRLPAARGDGRSLGRAALHQRARRHPRAADAGAGDGTGGSAWLFCHRGAPAFRAGRLCRVARDAKGVHIVGRHGALRAGPAHRDARRPARPPRRSMQRMSTSRPNARPPEVRPEARL